MPITIASNIASLSAQRFLGKASEQSLAVSERLSSGMRINRASDDASGLAVSLNLESSSRVLTRGIQNLNDGISSLNIAEGALSQLSSIVTRQLELATQASSGTFSRSQRDAMHNESAALNAEYNRIVATTTFNGVKLFQDTSTGLTLQAGYGSENAISINMGKELSHRVGNGTFETGPSSVGLFGSAGLAAADFNRDGTLDLVSYYGSVLRIGLNNGSGSFTGTTTLTVGAGFSGTAATPVINDFDSDGNLDVAIIDPSTNSGQIVISRTDGAGNFTTSITIAMPTASRHLATADFNNDGRADILSAAGVILNGSNGTFTQSAAFSSAYDGAVGAGDFDGDGNMDVAILTSNSVLIGYGNGDGSFKALVSTSTGNTRVRMEIADFNNDGKDDLVAVGPLPGAVTVLMGSKDRQLTSKSFTSPLAGGTFGITAGDINGDGFDDFAVMATNGDALVYIGNGDGTFALSHSFANGASSYSIVMGDFSGDGVVDLVANRTGSPTSVYTGNATSSVQQQAFSIRNLQSARDALNMLKNTLDRISSERASLGAGQSRLNTASQVLTTTRDNQLAANSRIMDIDVAAESSELLKGNIRQQIAVAILAQANQTPQLSLTLLKN